MKTFYKFLRAWDDHAVGDVLPATEVGGKSSVDMLVEQGVIERIDDGEAQTLDAAADAAVKEITESIGKSLREQGAKTVAELREELRGESPRLDIRVGRDRELDRPWGDKNTALGNFAVAVKRWQDGDHDKRLVEIAEKAPQGNNTMNGADGGFLVPEEVNAEIFERAYETDTLLGRVDTYPVQGNTMSFNMNAETSRATGSRFGGVRGYWTGEGSQKTSSYPTFKKVTLSLEKLAVLIYATDEMMDDSPMALSRYLTRAASQEINFLTGDAIVNGDGVGKPLGILNSPCVIAQAKETGQDNDTILGDNIIKMWSRMWGPSRRNAVWLINQEIEPQLMRMGVAITTVDGASTQIGRVLYLPPNGLADSPFGTLMGRPVIPSEWCAELGEQGDIILADLSQYLAITKGGIQSAMSIHLRFDYDETAWRFVYRIDGQPWWPSPLTPYKGSTGFTVGPFVTLAERDS